jgi:rhomboid protease GluP
MTSPAPGVPEWNQDHLSPDQTRLVEQLRRRVPVATLVLLAASIGLFVWLLTLGGPTNRENLVRLGALTHEALARHEFWRLLAAVFLFCGTVDIVPIAVVWSVVSAGGLYAFGSDVERLYGPGKLLAVFFLSGLAGTVASWLVGVEFAIGGSAALLGLSGILFVFGLRYRRHVPRYLKSRFAFRLLPLALLFFVLARKPEQGLNNYANLAGLAMGIVLGLLLPSRIGHDDALEPPVG